MPQIKKNLIEAAVHTVGADGVILTNAHVVAGADKVTVKQAAINMIEAIPKSKGGGEPVLVRRVVLRRVKLERAGLRLPEFDLDVVLAPGVGIARASFRTRDGAFTLTEINASTNGTFVNGERLEPFTPRKIVDGDIVQLALVPLRLHVFTGGG